MRAARAQPRRKLLSSGTERRRLLLGRQFADESPRNFGGLPVVVVNEETRLTPVFDLKVVEFRLRRNLVGFADSGVRLKDAEAVLEFHVKRVLPTEVADVLDFRELRSGERHFGIFRGGFHNRSSLCNSRINSRILRSTLGMSIGCIVSRFTRVISLLFLSNT